MTMDYKVELVARALHQAEPRAYHWDDETMTGKDRFREYARNAINLLDEDIGVLLWALEKDRSQV